MRSGGRLTQRAIFSDAVIAESVIAQHRSSSGYTCFEVIVTFDVKHVNTIFEIMNPYKRRHLSDAQRAQALENLARAREAKHQKRLAQKQFRAPESTRGAGRRGRPGGMDSRPSGDREVPPASRRSQGTS